MNSAKHTLLVISLFSTLLIAGCGGGGSDSSSQANGEEQNTETTDREDIALQGTVLKFFQYQAADGTRVNAGSGTSNDYLFLAPFQETWRAEFGCAAVTGSYLLNGNTLSMSEQTREGVEGCPTITAQMQVNIEITQRVIAGPSEISVMDGELTLTTENNEALVFVAGEEG